MTQDEIIEMAKQAGFERLGHDNHDLVCYPDDLLVFVDLVTQHTKNQLIDAVIKINKDAIEKGMALEREVCAQIADEWAVGWPHPSKVIALDIRARGQA
jgi:hypothetical protein